MDNNINQELLEACAAGNVTKLQQILDQPVHVEGLDELISLSLKESTERKQLDIIELLLEKTPVLQYSDNLMLLAFQGGWEVYELFIRKDPNILEHQHELLGSVLCLSVTGGNFQFLSRLLEAGADPGWTTNSPRSYWVTLPIEFAAGSGL